MPAAIFCGPGDIVVGDRPDPVIATPTDAVVRVVLSCVCGSDLWYYRGQTDYTPGTPIGHEFVGVAEQVGAEVRAIAEDDLVIAPFKYSDGTCVNWRAGYPSNCVNGGVWGPRRRRGKIFVSYAMRWRRCGRYCKGEHLTGRLIGSYRERIAFIREALRLAGSQS